MIVQREKVSSSSPSLDGQNERRNLSALSPVLLSEFFMFQKRMMRDEGDSSSSTAYQSRNRAKYGFGQAGK
jgi:hypothetical protein